MLPVNPLSPQHCGPHMHAPPTCTDTAQGQLMYQSPEQIHGVLQDHVLQRAFMLEPIHAIAASADGAFVAGGGASGTIYVWSTGTGQLLRSWPAHYKVTI